MIFRPGTDDQFIYDEVVTKNEYRIPPCIYGWKILDVGGHIGCFALMCAQRGAELIVSCEPFTDNYRLFLCNTYKFRSKIECLPVAVGSTTRVDQLVQCPEAGNNSGHTLLLHPWIGQGEIVRVVAMDDLDGVWDWVKLDCEGSEYEIIGGSKSLADRNKITRRLTIEFHEPPRMVGMVEAVLAMGWKESWRVDKGNFMVVDFVR